jgi:hypothetical protein
MAKEGYPASLNCWLKNFPRYIKITFGPEMENLDGPWGNSSVLLLERIGFDTPDTNPVEDEIPPDVKVTYSNNGTDEGWIFKSGMYGWGTFFATVEDDNYFILLEKWFEFESTYFDIVRFVHREVQETQIPKTESIPNVEVPVELIEDPPPEEDPPGEEPPGIAVDLDTIDHAIFAYNLVQAYWHIWNIDNLVSISVQATRTLDLDMNDYRLLSGNTGYFPYTIFFWTSGFGYLKVAFYQLDANCPDIWMGNPPEGCDFEQQITDAFFWTSLKINSIEKLPDLIRRA